jgi:M-phase inducer tyrosine phosphatase
VYTIDCRFPYEYSGGHIINAININDPVILQKIFFGVIQTNVALIFHCEFSQCRGPEMASFFRKIDRNMNEGNYPKLHYPHVYILEGGFCEFSRSYSQHIEGEYVRMLDGTARSTGALIASNTAFRENFARAKHSLAFDNEANEVKDYQLDPRALSPKIAKRRRMTSA